MTTHAPPHRQQRRRNRNDHLEHVEQLGLTITRMERTLRRSVVVARRHGASWQAIADALRCTRQAAWERFGREP